MRHSDLRVDAGGMVGEEVLVRELNMHRSPDILFQFDHSRAIQFPWWMLNLSGQQPAGIGLDAKHREVIAGYEFAGIGLRGL